MGSPSGRGKSPKPGAWFSPDGEAYLQALVHGAVQEEKAILLTLVHGSVQVEREVSKP